MCVWWMWACGCVGVCVVWLCARGCVGFVWVVGVGLGVFSCVCVCCVRVVCVWCVWLVYVCVWVVGCWVGGRPSESMVATPACFSSNQECAFRSQLSCVRTVIQVISYALARTFLVSQGYLGVVMWVWVCVGLRVCGLGAWWWWRVCVRVEAAMYTCWHHRGLNVAVLHTEREWMRSSSPRVKRCSSRDRFPAAH